MNVILFLYYSYGICNLPEVTRKSQKTLYLQIYISLNSVRYGQWRLCYCPWVKPPWTPIKKTTFLRSPITSEPYSSYCKASNNILSLLYFFMSCAKWRGGYVFLLWSSTALRFLNKLSMKSFQSSVLQTIPVDSNRHVTLWQKQVLSWGRKTLERHFFWYATCTFSFYKLYCLSLDVNTSAMEFMKPRSLITSLISHGVGSLLRPGRVL